MCSKMYEVFVEALLFEVHHVFLAPLFRFKACGFLVEGLSCWHLKHWFEGIGASHSEFQTFLVVLHWILAGWRGSTPE